MVLGLVDLTVLVLGQAVAVAAGLRTSSVRTSRGSLRWEISSLLPELHYEGNPVSNSVCNMLTADPHFPFVAHHCLRWFQLQKTQQPLAAGSRFRQCDHIFFRQCDHIFFRQCRPRRGCPSESWPRSAEPCPWRSCSTRRCQCPQRGICSEERICQEWSQQKRGESKRV